jgi:hypothetical protein
MISPFLLQNISSLLNVHLLVDIIYQYKMAQFTFGAILVVISFFEITESVNNDL